MGIHVYYVGHLEFSPELTPPHITLVEQYLEAAEARNTLPDLVRDYDVKKYLTTNIDHEGDHLSEECLAIRTTQDILRTLGIAVAGMIHYEDECDSDAFGYIHVHPDGSFALSQGVRTYANAVPYHLPDDS